MYTPRYNIFNNVPQFSIVPLFVPQEYEMCHCGTNVSYLAALLDSHVGQNLDWTSSHLIKNKIKTWNLSFPMVKIPNLF